MVGTLSLAGLKKTCLFDAPVHTIDRQVSTHHIDIAQHDADQPVPVVDPAIAAFFLVLGHVIAVEDDGLDILAFGRVIGGDPAGEDPDQAIAPIVLIAPHGDVEPVGNLLQAGAIMGKALIIGDIASPTALDFAGPGRAVERGHAVGQIRRVAVDAFLKRIIGLAARDQRILRIEAAAQKGGCHRDYRGGAH